MYCWRLITVVAITFLAGCTHLGPQTVTRDRFDYNVQIANSWKEQTLLNIVKIRYADMPMFLELASVVSGYTLEGTVNLGGTASSTSAIQGNFLSLGTSGKYTDRPTITYAPITGQQFNHSFLTPIPPQAVLFLMQSGWPAELILPVTVDSVNGLRASVVAGTGEHAGDPGYYRAIELLSAVHKSGSVGMQIKRRGTDEETTVLFFYQEHLPPELKAQLAEFDRLLGLNPDEPEISVTYGLLPKNDTEIALLTRSMLQIMIALAAQIKVPAEHVADGRTIGSVDQTAQQRLINIDHSVDKPDHAFTSVHYQDHWFWIDDRDFFSKRTFAFLMILFSLTESGGKEGLPLVTIPAG